MHSGDERPGIALSIRQPWAALIVSGAKDVENRSEAAIRNGDMRKYIGRRIAIHAAKGMTRIKYDHARRFACENGADVPEAWQCVFGAIIGSVRIVDIVKVSNSEWFVGPRGLVLADAVACAPIYVAGELGMFRWQDKPRTAPGELAKWMRPPMATDHSPLTTDQGVLL